RWLYVHVVGAPVVRNCVVVRAVPGVSLEGREVLVAGFRNRRGYVRAVRPLRDLVADVGHVLLEPFFGLSSACGGPSTIRPLRVGGVKYRHSTQPAEMRVPEI